MVHFIQLHLESMLRAFLNGIFLISAPGKFMAFPGEDYQKLLSHLATEIYHFRYPVEHGIDVLQGVVRSGSLDALQVCSKFVQPSSF